MRFYLIVSAPRIWSRHKTPISGLSITDRKNEKGLSHCLLCDSCMEKYHIEKNTVQETLMIPLYGRKPCAIAIIKK